MRLLILGGSQFLGRAIATHACAIGHDVTCAARGLSGPMAPGVRFVHVDRDVSNGLEPLARQEFDAVVDVSRHPGQVRRAVAASAAIGRLAASMLDTATTSSIKNIISVLEATSRPAGRIRIAVQHSP